jgi:hypothetical protein
VDRLRVKIVQRRRHMNAQLVHQMIQMLAQRRRWMQAGDLLLLQALRDRVYDARSPTG